ncbi:MAG: peptide chain release factor N(5)-glutamine methyltransferase [Halioglobus sp.]
MATVQALLHASADLTTDAPRRDAEILLCHVLQKDRAWLFTWPDKELDAVQAQQYLALLDDRRRGTPVAYLVGEREFWSLSLEVTEHTLIPRTETETLVEWALELPLPADASVMDLGTGTGAIALALASERPSWQVSALDKSTEAVAVARRNANRHGLERVTIEPSDWYGAVQAQQYDLVVSNPPYIDPGDPHLSRGDLPFEPRSALVAQDKGLADIKTIISGAVAHLRPGGWILLEHGYDQAEAVQALLQAQGFGRIVTRLDIAGQPRITGGAMDVE